MTEVQHIRQAWGTARKETKFPTSLAPLDVPFQLLPDELQDALLLTAQIYARTTGGAQWQTFAHKDVRKGDLIRRKRIVGKAGEHFEAYEGIAYRLVRIGPHLTYWETKRGTLLSMSDDWQRDTLIVERMPANFTPPNPVAHPHIIDRNDGRAWVWADANNYYIRIGDSATRDYTEFDDWEPARSVAVDE